MRTLAVLGLCCIFGVQADLIVDFFSNYSPCANGVSVCRINSFRALFQPLSRCLCCSERQHRLTPVQDCQSGEQCVSCAHSNISGELTGRPIGKYCSGPKDDIPLCKSHVIRGRVKTSAYADDFLMCLVATCAETRQDASEWEKLTELLRLRI